MFLFAEAGHHVPIIVEFINHYLGEPVYRFEMAYTRPIWIKFFARFGSTPGKVFGAEYSPDNAIPWYTIMFIIACLLTIAIVYLLRGKLSEHDPEAGQLTLQAGYLAVRDLIGTIIGEQGAKHFPVVATF